jgi:hypothetical protein
MPLYLAIIANKWICVFMYLRFFNVKDMEVYILKIFHFVPCDLQKILLFVPLFLCHILFGLKDFIGTPKA